MRDELNSWKSLKYTSPVNQELLILAPAQRASQDEPEFGISQLQLVTFIIFKSWILEALE